MKSRFSDAGQSTEVSGASENRDLTRRPDSELCDSEADRFGAADRRNCPYFCRSDLIVGTAVSQSSICMLADNEISDLLQDIRFGLRLLRRSPVFTLVAVSSLALGIGGAAAVFSLLNAIVLRSLPVAEPDRLFVAERHQPDEMSPRFPWPEAQRLRDDLAGQAEIAAASSVATMRLRPARGRRRRRARARLSPARLGRVLQRAGTAVRWPGGC